MNTSKTSLPADQNAPHGKSAAGTGRILRLFGGLSLLAAGLVSLYPPLGTAVFGPPVFPFAVAAFVLVTLAAAALAGTRWREIAARPERWAIPMAAAIGIALLASSFPDRAAFPALGLLLFPASIIVISALTEAAPDRAARCLHLFRAIAAVAIGIAVWGLFLWAVVEFGTAVGQADQIAEITGLERQHLNLFSFENHHPFGHKNFGAGFTILTLPILLAAVCIDHSRLRLLWLAGLPIVLFYLASVESRAAWLAVAAGLFLYLLLRLFRSRRGRRGRLGWSVLPILLVVLALPFLVSPRLRESLHQVVQKGNPAAIDPYRWDVFQTGVAVGNAQPFTGVGPGALSLASPEQRVSTDSPVVYQVHSTPLQLYAETGLVGIAGILFLGFGLIGAWRRSRKSLSPLERHLSDAAAISLLSYSLFALTDYQLDVPAIVLAAAVPAGVLLGLRRGPPGPVFRIPWLVAGALTAVLLLPMLWLNGKGLLARRHLEEAVGHLGTDTASFASEVRRAHKLAPSDPFYLNQLANMWMTEWMRAEDPTERNRLADNAREALEASLEIAPGQDSVHFNRGVLLRSQEKPEEALQAFQKALAYNPKKRFAWLLSGEALLKLDEEEKAAEALARELLVNPSSLFLPVWQEPRFEPYLEERDQHFKRLAETEDASARQLYLFYWSTGEPRPFEGDLDSEPDGFRVLLTALEGDPEAAVEIASFTREAFLVRAWLESEEAEEWLRAAFLQASGSAFGPSNLQLLGDRLREGKTFSAAFRSLLQEPGLPVAAKRSRPRASGLFERNFYGAPLFDFYIYYEPIVLHLF